MLKRTLIISLIFSILMVFLPVDAQRSKHTFKSEGPQFFLDNMPFQIISGEMYPARIPSEYWRHRIRMAKAMGCNTVTADILWNFHETEEGIFSFSEGNHNIADFISTVQDEDMLLILKPGPYINSQWALGGIPAYLLNTPDIKLRSLDATFMSAVERYISKLAEVIRPYTCTNGGPLIMIQIDDEYGSYGDNNGYLLRIKEIWQNNGVNIQFCTSDIKASENLPAGTIPGSAIGLVLDESDRDFDAGTAVNRQVPVFASRIITGTASCWGEEVKKADQTLLLEKIKYLMDNRISFNISLIHGGTNYGFNAAASIGGDIYKPYLTSHDLGAPVNENGVATPLFNAIKDLIGSYQLKNKKSTQTPDSVMAIDIPLIFPFQFTSVWDNLPQPLTSEKTLTLEALKQYQGFILYQKELTDFKPGKMIVSDVHDYATVFLSGQYIGSLDRRSGINSVDLPEISNPNPVLEILVESMGRTDNLKEMDDLKGITKEVTLNGNILTNWKIYPLPMDDRFIYYLRSSGKTRNKPGIFFKGSFSLAYTGDTYFDLSGYSKGVVWVNGHNLGRYWNIGQQKRLYCPKSYIRQGMNEIIIFDLHLTDPKTLISGSSAE